MNLPPRPKKPLSAYYRYLTDHRESFKKENPDKGHQEFLKFIGQSWECADMKLKEKYYKEYRDDLAKYVVEKANYNSHITDEHRALSQQKRKDIKEMRQRVAFKKRVRELGKPIRPFPPLFRFLAKEKTDTPRSITQTYRDWLDKAVEKWNKMSEADKESFKEECRKDFEVYQ